MQISEDEITFIRWVASGVSVFIGLCLSLWRYESSRNEVKHKDLEEKIEIIKEKYVSKKDVFDFFGRMEKNIITSNHEVRDAMIRVHERIDNIYKEMWGSKKND